MLLLLEDKKHFKSLSTQGDATPEQQAWQREETSAQTVKDILEQIYIYTYDPDKYRSGLLFGQKIAL